jgi:hypothetical protein
MVSKLKNLAAFGNAAHDKVSTLRALHIGAVIVSLFLSFIRHLSAKRTKYPPFIRQI